MARERVHDTLYTFHSECSLIINRNVRDNNTYGKAEPAEARVPAGSTVRGEFCAADESRLPAESRVPGESRAGYGQQGPRYRVIPDYQQCPENRLTQDMLSYTWPVRPRYCQT